MGAASARYSTSLLGNRHVKVLVKKTNEVYEELDLPRLNGAVDPPIYIKLDPEAEHFDGLRLRSKPNSPSKLSFVGDRDVKDGDDDGDGLEVFDRYRGKAALKFEKPASDTFAGHMNRRSSTNDATGIPGDGPIYIGGHMKAAPVIEACALLAEDVQKKGFAAHTLIYIGSGNGKNLAQFVPTFDRVIGLEVNRNQVRR